MTQAVPTIETAYRDHRGLFFGVFAKLATQGFVAQPPDAADIVHDFFVEEWAGIRRRFDPERATAFSTYLYTAFVRFARARIQRLHRQRGVLLDPQALMELQDQLAADSSPEDSLDVSQASEALSALHPDRRELVEKWLTRNRYSERELAREMGLSRYKLREQLVEAVGEVSLHFAAHTSRGEVDHRVAEAIWRDKLTPTEAAATLGLTEHQVRNARARNFHRIAQALTPQPVQPARTRNVVMSDNSIQALIGKIFSNAPIALMEPEVVRQAPELVRHLVESDGDVASEWQALPAERLARVYEAIARGMGTAEVPAPEVSEDDPFAVAHANDRRAVGRAFSEALVPALPNGLFPLLRACQARLRTAPRLVSEQLRREPDVIVAGSAAHTLAEFGLTPSHLVVAAGAVAMLIERAIAAGYFPSDQKLILVRSRRTVERNVPPTVEALTHEPSGATLTRAELVSEVCVVAAVEPATGEVLLDWLADSAPYVRSQFGSFTAEFARENIVLRPMSAFGDEEPADLYARWSNPSPISLAAAGLS